MKELSIKEKAELYDKALERAKNTIEVNQAVPNIVDCVKSLFPELIESEDEEIRKSITEFFKNYSERGTWKAISDVTKWIDWLERHGEQDNNEDVDILHRFSFYSYKDEPNVLYLSGLYVNEEYRNKGIGTKILKVADEVAKSLDCRVIRLKTKRGSDAERLYRTHGYNSLEIEDKDEIWLEKQGEQKPLGFNIGDEITVNGQICKVVAVEQKPAWSEEDDSHIYSITEKLKGKFEKSIVITKFSLEEDLSWLKSLKVRVQLQNGYNPYKRIKPITTV